MGADLGRICLIALIVLLELGAGLGDLKQDQPSPVSNVMLKLDADEGADDYEYRSSTRRSRYPENFQIPLRRVWAQSKAKCMDGSKVGYYIRKNEESKKWVIFLEGGSYCYDLHTCRSRVLNTPQLTSSNGWPLAKAATGILSSDPEENPLLFFANAVYLPYCSGDVWIGNTTSKKGQHFMGAVIIEDVIKELLQLGLQNARKLYLVGGSAGATGVLMNIDRVTSLLQSQGAFGINVFGIVDSGWFFEAEKSPSMQRHGKCSSLINCPPIYTIKKGYRFWNAHLPQNCVEQHADEPWLCFFGPRVYPHIRSPVFLVQFLYDAAQIMTHVSFDSPDHGNEAPMKKIALQALRTLRNVTAVFAMSCYAHEVITLSYWHKLRVHGTSIVDAIRCWEESQEVTNRALSPSSRSLGTSPAEEEQLARSQHSAADRTTAAMLSHHAEYSTVDGEHSRSSTVTTAELDHETKLMADSNQLPSYRKLRLQKCRYRVIDSCNDMNCNALCPGSLSGTHSSLQSDHAVESNRNSRSDYKLPHWSYGTEWAIEEVPMPPAWARR